LTSFLPLLRETLDQVQGRVGRWASEQKIIGMHSPLFYVKRNPKTKRNKKAYTQWISLMVLFSLSSSIIRSILCASISSNFTSRTNSNAFLSKVNVCTSRSSLVNKLFNNSLFAASCSATKRNVLCCIFLAYSFSTGCNAHRIIIAITVVAAAAKYIPPPDRKSGV